MRAILLVPSEAHRDRLLATGPCEATPPMAWQHWHSGRWIAPGGKLSAVEFVKLEDDPPVALVLAWAGAAVPEGCDRAARVLASSAWSSKWPTAHGVAWKPSIVSDRYGIDGWELDSTERDEAVEFIAAADARIKHSLNVIGPLRFDVPVVVPALGNTPADIGALLPAWALAIVCAARGLGEVVTVD